MSIADVVIVGGGVIGMLTARELAANGSTVTLIDKGELASEASWAGGGIVSPLYPWRYCDGVTALASWSQNSYIDLCQHLKDETGVDPELRQKGLLMLSVEDKQEALDWAHRYQRPLEEVAGDFVYQREPSLKKGIESALWMPKVCSVRNPRLGQSLKLSLDSCSKVSLRPFCPMLSLAFEGQTVVGVNTPSGVIPAGKVILCAGAWSGELAQQLNLDLPVQPVKGQMLLFRAVPGLLDRVVLDSGRYLIPRQDGRILVGSTLEFKGFSKQTTEEAYQSLYQSALAIMPALADHPVEAQWAGLRPGSPSGIPYIGEIPEYRNLFVNAGHFRNGLVLAPASCRLAADLLLGRPTIIDPAPYSYEAPRLDRMH
ncbi:MAG: glycine oxidase ThiO [Motiliproteus sp.]